MPRHIKINGDNYRLVVSFEEIQARIKELAKNIAEDYSGREVAPVLLIVLNGGLYFGADLSRALSAQGLEHEVDTIGLASYNGDENGGDKIKVVSRPRLNLAGRDVIIVEDILDRGDTLHFLFGYLSRAKQDPRSLNSCILCVKEKPRQPVMRVSYFGFSIGPEWVVGAGMDSNGLYRGLPGLYQKFTKVASSKKIGGKALSRKSLKKAVSKKSGETATDKKFEHHLSPDFSDLL